MHLLASPASGGVHGKVRVPGDKSISHRAVMLAAIADGTSRIRGLLQGDDVLATLNAFAAMGVQASAPAGGELKVQGVGMRGLRAPAGPLDLGNSGTAMRLLCGLLAAQPFAVVLVGDASLSKRPMGRVAEPLRRMGGSITTGADGTPPVRIRPVPGLRGIDYRLPVASAQVKSALLLAALYADGRTCVEEPAPTRDHTERMLEGFGYPCERSGNRICLEGGGLLRATDVDIPADMSSAAFFIVAALLAAGEPVRLQQVGMNPTRTGLVDVLRRMGGRIEEHDRGLICGEPVADLVVERSELRAVEVPAESIPLAIDEIPVLCIAAACAGGRTVIRGAEELRHKESDRIRAMASGLHELGIAVEEFRDGLAITGGRFAAGTVKSFDDHRVAMSFCIAALNAAGPIRVLDCDNISTSFPNFLALAGAAGMQIDVED